MIKFKALIHKETGTVIKYEDWKELYSCDNGKVLPIENGLKYYYDSKEMLFGDDFKIIYDSEFTREELIDIYRGMNNRDLCNKVMEMIKRREELIAYYEIEV